MGVVGGTAAAGLRAVTASLTRPSRRGQRGAGVREPLECGFSRFVPPMQIARWLHLMGAVVWIGGMFFAHFALRPAAQALPPPVRLPLLAATLSRFFAWAGAAVVAILASGVWLSDAMGGFRATGWAVHLMTAVGLVMALVYGYIVSGPYRRLRAAVADAQWEAAAPAMATIRRLVGLNLALGLVTIAVAVVGR